MLRFVAQSFAGWPNERTGGTVTTEDDPLDPDPPAAQRRSLAAIRRLEHAVVSALRSRGSCSATAPLRPRHVDGERVRRADPRPQAPARRRRAGIWSFLHVDDAAAASVIAVEHGSRGLYNIVDDEPAPVSRSGCPTWPRAWARRRRATFPSWLARFALGERRGLDDDPDPGSSNAKARRELGWEPAVGDVARRLPRTAIVTARPGGRVMSSSRAWRSMAAVEADG